MSILHHSVLLKECLEYFNEKKVEVFVDGTLGAGGHAEGFLKAHPEIKSFVGIDQDPDALAIAKERLAAWKDKLFLCQGNFSNLAAYLNSLKIQGVDGVLVDLGVSSMQLDRADKGFSFMRDGPLDMRMDPNLPFSAEDLVNDLDEEELGRILREYGEEEKWRKAARAIVSHRKQKRISRTLELAEILDPVLREPVWKKRGKIHPLTKTFQALRIAVNQELEKLEEFLKQAIPALKKGGRLAVITFHSLEDRIVKRYFQQSASDKVSTSGIGGMFLNKDPEIMVITRKPRVPEEEEILRNPRSRSAKLRVVEKL